MDSSHPYPIIDVRPTCTGRAYERLGRRDAADLRAPLRNGCDDTMLGKTIEAAIGRKPKGLDFLIDRRHADPAVPRTMSMTGG